MSIWREGSIRTAVAMPVARARSRAWAKLAQASQEAAFIAAESSTRLPLELLIAATSASIEMVSSCSMSVLPRLGLCVGRPDAAVDRSGGVDESMVIKLGLLPAECVIVRMQAGSN